MLRDPILSLISQAEPVDELVIHENEKKVGGPFAFSADIKDGAAVGLRWYGPLSERR